MRALLIVLDSVGCGHAPDAATYGDDGADTLGHIFAAQPDLALPHLFSLGLWKAITGDVFDPRSQGTRASWGRMRERSAGKDTTSGHWELAGALLDQPFGTFTKFPDELVRAIEGEAGVEFIGNYAQSGTTILDELGAEHVRTKKPILYTSADSVLQIAAHESVIAPKRLYEICRIARRHCDPHRIGRVIARPFIGEPGAWQRTSGRHDFSMVPPPTILNAISDTGLPVHGVGKISDIFAGSGITASTPTASNAEGMRAIEEIWSEFDEGLVFANLVDFDMLFGHRRDVAGYAQALAEFDAWLGTFLPQLDEDDLVILTADHGNDPTWRGTDHTREEVPLLVVHRGFHVPLGTRRTFADVAASLADAFQLRDGRPTGTSFLPELNRHARSYFHRAEA
ncbi:MAG: phosphopentomutase [Chthoniobacteraceae bacterium]